MSDLLPCPFCGKPAKIYGTNLVGCEDTVNCGGEVDWGHNINPAGPIAAWNRRALPAVQPDAAAIREAALREAADVDWASGLEIRDDAPDYLSEWQRGFVSGCTAFRNAILALKGETP